jgi:hypothetical protein
LLDAAHQTSSLWLGIWTVPAATTRARNGELDDSAWVQRFTPLLAEAARPCRHAVGDHRWVDETHVKVAGQSR